MPACDYSRAPKRRTSPVPPHRRHLPQRSGWLEFLLLPPHDGQRRIGWIRSSIHQMASGMPTMSKITPATSHRPCSAFPTSVPLPAISHPRRCAPKHHAPIWMLLKILRSLPMEEKIYKYLRKLSVSRKDYRPMPESVIASAPTAESRMISVTTTARLPAEHQRQQEATNFTNADITGLGQPGRSHS